MSKEKEDITLKVKDLYFKYGIKSVSMDDVAHESGISKKTLYQHFKDKAELVESVINLVFNENMTIINTAIETCDDAISEMYEIHVFMNKIAREHSYSVEYDLKKYYPHLHELIINTKRERIYSIGLKNLKRGKKEGFYRPEINEKIIAKINLMRLESSIDNCIFSDNELLSQDYFKEMLIYHIRGIATHDGIKKLDSLLKNNKL
ncbi:MAG: TetR/AcrR family transcriptional regulator [Marinilabiliaceae bacterium]|nr:TetR/AcrR family transcriptional regulator [Marinilabiliaceae bacterium]